MIKIDDILTFIKNYDDPSMQLYYNIDMDGLERFIKPETNLYSLIMLSKARANFLDLTKVDEGRFFKTSVLNVPRHLVNRPVDFEGDLYMQYQLAPILLEGQSFDYIDHCHPLNYGFEVDTKDFVNEIIDHFLKNTKFKNPEVWYDKDVQTITQLTDYINKLLSQSKVKAYLVSKIPTWNGFLNLLFSCVVLLVFGLYYGCKAVNRAFKWVFESSDKLKPASNTIETFSKSI